MEVRTTGVPVIGEKELRRAAEILRRCKQGRQNLERRIIADEDWWKLRQWRQFADKGNPNDDRPASGWLFNVIMGKHADAIAAYPGPNIRPREPDDRMEAQMLSSILPCILEQNDFEEVYPTRAGRRWKQGTGVWGVYWDQEKLGGLGDISIRPVNVLNLVWEPGVTDIQKSQNVFYLELEGQRDASGGVSAAGGKARRQQRAAGKVPDGRRGGLVGKDAGGGLVLQKARGGQDGAALLQVCGADGLVRDGERYVRAVGHAGGGGRAGRTDTGAGAGARARVRAGTR